MPGEPPHDRAQLKIYYPAQAEPTEESRNTGLIPAVPCDGGYPVVLFSPGVNVSPDAYGWLARELVLRGYVVVLYGQIAEEMPGFVSLSPGFDFAGLTPDGIGKTSSASAHPALLDCLRKEAEGGVLAGVLDLDRIVCGGHSAGGTLALINANPDWIPGLKAVFSYGAHTGASTALGHPPDTLVDIDPRTPALIIGGTRDGCIAESAARYDGVPGESATARVEQTFDRSVSRREGDSVLALFEGANHFTFTHPFDDATGRAFIDWSETEDGDRLRTEMAGLIAEFLDAVLAGKPAQAGSPGLASTYRVK